MDRSNPEVLQFDRFALDFGRGCLRAGGRNVVLRPKTFEVLRTLAENAERLVSKQQLYDAVWPNVTVTDDSLVQCIRELRVKLGDDTHSLIKTIPRRGYLLDAKVTPVASHGALAVAEPVALGSDMAAPRPGLHLGRARRWGVWGAVTAGVLSAVLGGAYSSGLLAHPELPQADLAHAARRVPVAAGELFTAADVERVAAIAGGKQLPLPAFRIGGLAGVVSDDARRFVGIWVSDTGWSVSHRQLMLIVTDVDGDGTAAGYVVHGPPQPKSHIQSSANFSRFQARIGEGLLSFSDASGDHSALFTMQNQIMFRTIFRDGMPASVMLDPVWTLVGAERAVAGR